VSHGLWSMLNTILEFCNPHVVGNKSSGKSERCKCIYGIPWLWSHHKKPKLWFELMAWKALKGIQNEFAIKLAQWDASFI